MSILRNKKIRYQHSQKKIFANGRNRTVIADMKRVGYWINVKRNEVPNLKDQKETFRFGFTILVEWYALSNSIFTLNLIIV